MFVPLINRHFSNILHKPLCMKSTLQNVLILLSFLLPILTLAQNDPPLGEDSKTKSGVPTGEIKGPFTWSSSIYPGTTREYWIYVPKQYDASKPTCSVIVQDGLNCAESWKLPTVLDNLIHKKEIPVMIGIFVTWGKVEAGPDNHVRYNRSFEYDGMGDRYARFLLEEIIPEVSKTYNLSKDPNDRMLAGQSSGAICAFNAAWERPDAFRRVYSGIGTYVGLRGGDEFSTLVRKCEPKPLRVFIEDGSNDLNIYAGHWWTANQAMLAALEWAGYEVNHAFGDGGHNGKHTASIMPDAMRWIWKEYPKPVEKHFVKENRLSILKPGEEWTEVIEKGHSISCITSNESGELFFYNPDEATLFKTNDGAKPTSFAKYDSKISRMSFGADKKLYAIDSHLHKIVRIGSDSKVETLIDKVNATDLLVTQKGIYFTETDNDRFGFYNFSSKKTIYYSDLNSPSGLALYGEQTFLLVASADDVFGYSYKINDNGSLDYGQAYMHYHVPYGAVTAGASGLLQDADGSLYTMTNMGIQVTDQLGRVNIIMEYPQRNVSQQVCFGGNNLSELYALSNGKLFKRVLNTKGVMSWGAAIKPPKPGL